MFLQGHRRNVANVGISPLVLLLFAMLGCGSGTEPAKTPAQPALGDPFVNSVGMQFKLLSGGTFKMGEGNEVHPVTTWFCECGFQELRS